jgi:hypothetical protein
MIIETYYSLPYTLRRFIYAALRRREYQYLQQKRLIDTDSGYSYKPFVQKKCIFVHIPKAAGVSVCRTLFNNLAGAHQTIAKYQIAFSKNEFDSYFKFTFVRNPWDRIFSAYNFLKGGGMNDTDKNWAILNLSEYNNFDDFVRRWVNSSNIHKYTHFLPQYRFICLPGSDNLQVDFLGYYENIEDDFVYIRNKLASDNEVTLKYENRTESNEKKRDYREYYTDETRNIVYEVYKKDIDLLGYDFDNASLKTQLKKRFT